MKKLIAILLLSAAPALATPGDVQGPDGSWGQPDKPDTSCKGGCDPKPEPPKPSEPKAKEDKDHVRGVIVGEYCMGFWDGRKQPWQIGKPDYAYDSSKPLPWCDCLKHPVGTLTPDGWCAKAKEAGVMK